MFFHKKIYKISKSIDFRVYFQFHKPPLPIIQLSQFDN